MEIIYATIIVLNYINNVLTVKSCTPNSNYGYYIKYPKSISICAKLNCEEFLTDKKTYSGCRIGSDNPQAKFRISRAVRITNYTNMITEIYSIDDSKKKFDKELYKSSHKFQSKNFKSGNSFILECGKKGNVLSKTATEIPSITNPIFHIIGFDYTFQKIVEVPPATIFKCEPNCLENKNQAMMTVIESNKHLRCDMSTCGFIKTSGTKYNAHINCGYGDFTHEIKFIINYDYTVKLKNIHSKKARLINRVDILEELECEVTFKKNPKANINLNVRLAKIYLFQKIKYNNTEKHLNKDNEWVAKIPHPFPKDLYYKCYLGDLNERNDQMRYYVLQEKELLPASTALTIMQCSTSNLAIHTYPQYEKQAYVKGTDCFCNLKNYPSYKSIKIAYFRGESALEYPLSEFMAKTKIDFIHKFTVKEFDSSTIHEMYFSCVEGDSSIKLDYKTVSVPSIIYQDNLPSIDIVYIHPPWKTDYFLIGSVILCEGINVLNVQLSCLTCKSDSDNPFVYDNSTKLTFIIKAKQTLVTNVKVTLRCKGLISLQGRSIYTDIKYEVVTQKVASLGPQILYEVDKDYVACLAEFSVFRNKRIVIESVPMRTNLWIGKKLKENTPYEKYLKVVRNNFDSKEYSYCCPAFVLDSKMIKNSKYTCQSKKDLLVTEKYDIKLNRKFDDIYPGVSLKCLICVQYTIDAIKNCPSDRLLSTTISMVVVYYNQSKKIINDVVTVRMPKDEIKKNSSEKIKPDEYVINVGCRIRKSEKPKMFRIHLKSCNSQPPLIFIRPKQKSMFLIGDVFTCDTDNIDCRNKLKYKTKVYKNGKVINESDYPSMIFTYKHLGNSIKIVCESGSVVKKKDERYIRVEHKPFGIRIVNLKPVMQIMEFLRCDVQGFPKPKIMWSKNKGLSRLKVNEFNLLISPWDPSGYYSYDCTATNYRGTVVKRFNFTLFNFRMPEQTHVSHQFIIILSITTFIFIIISCISIVLIFQEYILDRPLTSLSYFAKDTDSLTEEEKLRNQQTYNIINRKSVMELHLFSKAASHVVRDNKSMTQVLDQSEETITKEKSSVVASRSIVSRKQSFARKMSHNAPKKSLNQQHKEVPKKENAPAPTNEKKPSVKEEKPVDDVSFVS